MRRFFLFRLSMKVLFFTVALASPLVFGQNEQKAQNQQQVEETPSTTEDFFHTTEAPVTYKGAFVKMMLTLLALIVLIVISVWMLRRISHGRMKQMNYGRTIKILERRPLSAKSILYLVEIGGKKVVIAESQVEVRPITVADHLNAEDQI